MSRGTTQPEGISERALPIRLRPDLLIEPQQVGGRRSWIVKDPLSLDYWQLGEEEFFIASQLDGQTSLQQIQEDFEQVHAPRRLPIDVLHAFIGTLHSRALVLSDSRGQGEQLLTQYQRRKRLSRLGAVTNVLAIRFRGFDPERLLTWVYPKLRFLFSTWFTVLYWLLVGGAATLVLVEFGDIRARLPELRAFFGGANLLWLLATIAGVKMLHEWGHALTCKHHGGECHEMGVMLLAFVPCLYCNVSDAWLLSRRRDRIAISAGGIRVELFLAAVCTFVWWHTQPGLLHWLCLNVMFVCSVGTVLFNGNPLLRYDGYYILSDLVGIPNLAPESRHQLKRFFGRVLLGLRIPASPLVAPRRPWLVPLYAIASFCYRWFVVLFILWFLYKILKLHDLEMLAFVLLFAVVFGSVAVPLWGLWKFLEHPTRRFDVNRVRLGVALLVLAGAIVLVCLVPLPRHVTALAVLEVADADYVYAPLTGTLKETSAAGRKVTTGAKLGVLQNRDLELRFQKLSAQRDRQQLRIENLELLRTTIPSETNDLPVAREALRNLEQQLELLKRQREDLALRAPRDGVVIAPPSRGRQNPDPEGLSTWRGTLLEEKNLGATIQAGTLFCLVGDPRRVEAILLIHEDDIELIRPGQRVQLRLDQLSGATLHGTVTEIGKVGLRQPPHTLAGAAELTVSSEQQGTPQMRETIFQARVALDESDVPARVWAPGRARIEVASESAGSRLMRSLRQTFRFRS